MNFQKDVMKPIVEFREKAQQFLITVGATTLVFSTEAMAAETSTSIATTISALWVDMTKFFTGAEGFLLAGLIILVAGFGMTLVRRVTSKA